MIKYRAQGSVITTICILWFGLVSGILFNKIQNDTINLEHVFVSIFFYVVAFLILIYTHSYQIIIDEKAVRLQSPFENLSIPIQHARIETQYIYKGVPTIAPVICIYNHQGRIEVPYYLFGKQFEGIIKEIEKLRW